MMTFGCIGCGNMGAAILKGLAEQDWPEELALVGYHPRRERVEALSRTMPVTFVDSALEVASKADMLLIAVKPHQTVALLEELRPALNAEKLVLSVAAGISVETLKQACANSCPVVRIMPNTPAMVGEGIFALCFDPVLEERRQALVSEIFSAIGQVLVIPEEKFAAFTAVAGCGPAYVFHVMEAVVEAGVTLGFTRQEATDMVIALFKGSVTLADESETHLSLLREMVCSPAGVTIEAVNHLDRMAIRGSIIDAILKARDKGIEMSR